MTGTSDLVGLPSVMPVKIAVIGSFRQHYLEVRRAIDVFRAAGWAVTSPAGSEVLDPDVKFVRFSTDLVDLSDAEIQAVTLEHIFDADVVYVVAPNGYVGRTTCYEMGRLIQARRPIYLSHYPDDLPIRVPERFVLDPARLVELMGNGTTLESMHAHEDDLLSRIETGLTC